MRTKEDLDKYLSEMRDSVKYPGPRRLYFPGDIVARKEGNFRLARELGHGLKDFAPQDVKKILGNLYGTFIVANSLDITGVQVDAKEFMDHLNLPRQFLGSPPTGGK